ncbi:MAG: hypothetical protein ACRCUT_12375, partial [Spirochaetota bacterium]
VEQARPKPSDEIEAYLQMQLEKRDFILFKKGEKDASGGAENENRNYALIFKNGDGLRMAALPVDALKKSELEDTDVLEYDVTVKGSSASNPKLECKKSSGRVLRRMTVNDALVELVVSGREYMPYLNAESDVFNVIYSSGKKICVVVPAAK